VSAKLSPNINRLLKGCCADVPNGSSRLKKQQPV
jgi:hypothetical protein